MPLLYALRNDVGLNNPRFGCGLAQCGACTVHLGGEPIPAACKYEGNTTFGSRFYYGDSSSGTLAILMA